MRLLVDALVCWKSVFRKVDTVRTRFSIQTAQDLSANEKMSIGIVRTLFVGDDFEVLTKPEG